MLLSVLPDYLGDLSYIISCFANPLLIIWDVELGPCGALWNVENVFWSSYKSEGSNSGCCTAFLKCQHHRKRIGPSSRTLPLCGVRRWSQVAKTGEYQNCLLSCPLPQYTSRPHLVHYVGGQKCVIYTHRGKPGVGQLPKATPVKLKGDTHSALFSHLNKILLLNPFYPPSIPSNGCRKISIVLKLFLTLGKVEPGLEQILRCCLFPLE